MNKNLKIEIIVPFGDNMCKGDKFDMKETDAIKYEKEGLVKILNKSQEKSIKKVKVTNTNDFKQKKNSGESLYKIIFDRHRSLLNPCYINVFAGDDQKKKSKIYSFTYDIHKKDDNFIKNELETYNISSYGVFFNFNLLNAPTRNNANISKILYVFVDLDNAKEDHNELIKDNLNKKNISYCYNAKSGHGYHFLIPVELDPTDKVKVKGFLTYLKNNICDKVDIATHTNERLIRAPESLHNKDIESKQLITLHTHTPDNKEIENNSSLVLKYQEDQKKGSKDSKYQNSIKLDDIFFSTILNNKQDWIKYYEYLNKSEDRHDFFVKNLGFFYNCSEENRDNIDLFISGWEPSRIKALKSWAEKAKTHNTNVLYGELHNWCEKNGIEEWVNLLKKQLGKSFLDDYEFYYLEDEKNENNCVMYYPEKNYYVQKSIIDVILNVYYDCKEKGIDLKKALGMEKVYIDFEKFSFSKQLKLIQDQIRRKIEQQNRMKKVFNIGYEPSENKFISYNGKTYFNTYSKTSLWDYYKKQNKYHFPNIKELILNLCGNDKKAYNYLNNWIAWQIKNPTIKLPTALILQGKQGSGKGTFKTLILDQIFGENCQEINQTHLESQFNEYLLGKQIIVANEVMHNENRQTLPNVLKNLVTDDRITISRKFRKEIVGQNYTHWIFCTNSDNPIKIEEDDRRYSVFYSEKLRKGLGKDLRENLDYEIKEYLCFLKDLEPVFEDVSEPLMTEAKQEIIDLNKSSVEKFIEYLKQFDNLFEAHISVFNNDSNYIVDDSFGDGFNYVPTDNLYLLYEKWCEKFKERGLFAKQNFSKKLSNKGCKSIPKWKGKKSIRMYNLEKLESL